MKKSPFMMFIGIAVMAFVLVQGFIVWSKAGNLNAEVKTLESNKSILEQQLLAYEADSANKAIGSKNALEELKTASVAWSRVITDMRGVVRGPDGDIVDVFSYSGNNPGSISLSAKTNEGTIDPYFDVADFIEAVDDSPKFVGGFVPSLSAGFDAAGNGVLTFLMNVEYVADATEIPVEPTVLR